MLPIGLYLLGSAPDPVRDAVGDYVDWFSALAAAADARVIPMDGRGGARVDLTELAAVIISGSPASLTAPEPWMEAAFELVDRAVQRGTPILGVCFGHQLLAAHVGAVVRENPGGWEAGTRSIELTAAGRTDPLFAGVSPRFDANQVHRDEVAPGTLPASVRVLAENAKSAVQALAIGELVRGVQFHPEVTGAIVRSYLAHDHEVLARDAALRGRADEHPDALVGHDCPAAPRIFMNFIDAFARKA